MDETLGPVDPTDDLNLAALQELTPETRTKFEGTVAKVVELGRQGNTLRTHQARRAKAILIPDNSKTMADVRCYITEEKPPGQETTVQSGVEVSIMTWPNMQPGETFHEDEPIARVVRNGEVIEDTMGDEKFAYAVQDIEHGLPGKTVAWLQKAKQEAGRASDPAFAGFAVNDLLDQAPSVEALVADPSTIDKEKVHNYAVTVVEERTEHSRVTYKNGSQIDVSTAEGNPAYWKDHSDHASLTTKLSTQDGREYVYARYPNGSEQLTVQVSGSPEYEAVRAQLKATGATVLDAREFRASASEVAQGVQAPNETTTRQMTDELQAALQSGIVTGT